MIQTKIICIFKKQAEGFTTYVTVGVINPLTPSSLFWQSCKCICVSKAYVYNRFVHNIPNWKQLQNPSKARCKLLSTYNLK